MSRHEESQSQGGPVTARKKDCGCGEARAEAPVSPHSPASSEGGEGGFPVGLPVLVDQVAPSFEGESIGELESVVGFDPLRAFSEGVPSEFLTDEMLSLGECLPSEAAAETICGNDDRVEITNTTAAPWRWNCKLIITFPNGARGGCTGWFIGRKAVMTAGHCVYSQANGGWARQIEVIPGMRGATRPFGSMVGTSFRSVTGWTTNADPNYDYGCIILPSPALGDKVGYFGFAALTDASLTNLLVNNTGYPGDKPFGTQWYNAGRVSRITPRKIYYMLDTYGGQSGSAVWRSQGAQKHAVGVHAYGGCPNSATRITTEVFNNMLNWRNS